MIVVYNFIQTANCSNGAFTSIVGFRGTATTTAVSRILQVTLAVDQPRVVTVEATSIPDMIGGQNRQVNNKFSMAAIGISRRLHYPAC